MTRPFLYATTNPGKMMEIRNLMRTFDLDLLAPQDIGLDLDVAEDGTTLEENARLKAQAYLDALAAAGRDDVVVMADDTGLEIDALGGEPGIHVRRWLGYTMEDEAIIDLCLSKMAGIAPAQRGAQFRTVIALGAPGMPLKLFDGTLRGVIQEQPGMLRIPGFPFEALFSVPEWGMLLGEIHYLPVEQKATYITHREHAVRRALPAIRALVTNGA
jgi:XTP/dITP diphosphohydrolase